MRDAAMTSRWVFSCLRLGLALVGLASLSACALLLPNAGEGYSVSVDGYAAPNAGALRRFVILPLDKAVEPGDLRFHEYASVVCAALERRGLRNVDSFDEADLAVFLAYGIGGPEEHRYTYSLPVFGQTGVAASTTHSQVYLRPTTGRSVE
jgi:hypothetical protein